MAQELAALASETSSQCVIFYVKNYSCRLNVTEFAVSIFQILIYTNCDNKITFVKAFSAMWEYTSDALTVN